MNASSHEDRIIRVDMTSQKVVIEEFPRVWMLLGGRALSARILLNECDPRCDPLGPGNILVLAPGLMSGTAAPTSGRLSVGCKSPLTGAIKEANVGGEPAQDLMKLGYRAIVVTGQPRDRTHLWGLAVSSAGVKLVRADEYQGMWNYPACEKLLSNFPDTASAISIGPAGEMMLAGASVACTDRSKRRHPARHAARGGVGAVMGSKRLKWVVIDAGKVPVRQPADPRGFSSWVKSFSKDYLAGSRYATFRHGTSAAVPVANMLWTFPYKNRTEGRNPEFEKLDGARIRETFSTRGGGMHNCMTGCIVRCSNVVHDANRNYLTSALEFETLTLLGSCCAINNWEDVAELDRLCDELGLDTIETGAAIAVLMDSGGMSWGDAPAAKKLLREDVATGSPLGRLVGNGALSMGRYRKHARVPVARGQAIPAWDPRPLKVAGITYATSAMGADHTAGLVIDSDLTGAAAAVVSQRVQIINAVCDSSGFCMFLGPSLDETRRFYSLFFGMDVSREQMHDLGWRCLDDEWKFNERAGFTPADDDIAACMREEGIGPDKSMIFDVPGEAMAITKIRQPATEELFTKSPAG